MSLCRKLLTATILSVAIVSPALADVTWDFTSTSAVGRFAASLTVSNADFAAGNVSYTYSSNCPGSSCDPPFTVSGDTDFLFDVEHFILGLDLPLSEAILSQGFNSAFYFSGSIDFNFDALGNITSGTITDFNDNNDLTMTVTNNLAVGQGPASAAIT
jgi:hypothetical protein